MKKEMTTVFVNGVWKSGNHLVYSALNELGISGPFNGIAAHLVFGRHRFIKRLIRGDPGGVDVGLETNATIRRSYISAVLRRRHGGIIGGHSAYSRELNDLVSAENARIVIIRRDPRDILMSFADWICSRPDYFLYSDFIGLSRDERIARLLRGGQGNHCFIHPFTDVLVRAEPWLSVPGSLQVSFEDLIGAEGGGRSDAQMETVAKLHAHVNAPKPLSDVLLENIYGSSLTFNKGRRRRLEEIKNPALVREIENTLTPILAAWGYRA